MSGLHFEISSFRNDLITVTSHENMKKMDRKNILFLGGNQLGCRCLKEVLRNRKLNIECVIGRYDDYGSIVNPKAWNASLARVAFKRGLCYVQPKSLDDQIFLGSLDSMDRPDYIIICEYDKSLNEKIISLADEGIISINLGNSLENGEYFPIPWSIVNGYSLTVTLDYKGRTQRVTECIARVDIPFEKEDTAYTLYSKATLEGYKLFSENLNDLIQSKFTRPDKNNRWSLCSDTSLPDDHRHIRWDWTADRINRMIRALTFPPYPTAHTYYKDMEIEFLEPIEVIDDDKNDFNPGQIVDILPDRLIIQTQKGCLSIKRVRINESLTLNAMKFSEHFNISIGDIFCDRN